MIYYDTQLERFVTIGEQGSRMVRKYIEVKLTAGRDDLTDEEREALPTRKSFVGLEPADIPAHWLQFKNDDSRFGSHPGKKLVFVKPKNDGLTPEDAAYSYGDLVLQDIPPPTPEEIERKKWRQAKATRALLISQVTVTTQAGNVFHGDEESQNRMDRAVSRANGDNSLEVEWKLIADQEGNTEWRTVPVSELAEAAHLAGLEQTRIMKEAEAS